VSYSRLSSAAIPQKFIENKKGRIMIALCDEEGMI
jgi:hypothetical protein